MSWDLVTKCTVAITNSTNQVKGTGFFVSPQGHLLTCSHVVEATERQPHINQQIAEIVYQGNSSRDDFAVLRIPNPSGQFVPIGLEFQPTDPFLSIGYGRIDFSNDGATLEGSITDVNPQANFSDLPMLRLLVAGDAQRFEGGYSGAPVFNLRSQQVIGLIAARDHDRGGLAVPLTTVQKYWNKLVQCSLDIEFPGGALPIDSPFYIKRLLRRSNIYLEDYCNDAITKSCPLLCIQAPKLMGKTSLMLRVLDHANRQGYETVWLDLREAEASFSEGLSRFLHWFCQEVAQQLDLRVQPDQSWNDNGDPIRNCTNYFTDHVLRNLGQDQLPSGEVSQLILGLDDVHRTFSYSEISRPFFSMLRAWHEKGKRPTRMGNLWRRLGFVLTHSTDVYIDLGNQSPFNVAECIELPELTREQAKTLANLYGFSWSEDELKKLVSMVGGRPHLLRLAMHHLCNHKEMTLTQLLKEAPTDCGIYRTHLQDLLKQCREQKLEASLNLVMPSNEPVIDTFEKIILQGMGLVKLRGNSAIPSCELYRLYFSG